MDTVFLKSLSVTRLSVEPPLPTEKQTLRSPDNANVEKELQFISNYRTVPEKPQKQHAAEKQLNVVISEAKIAS